MDKILIVEDSKMFAKLLSSRVTADFQTDCDIATSYKDTVFLVENEADKYLLAVLDLNLPDAPDGEIVDYVVSKGIPAVVVTGRLDEKTRSKILSKRVLDYIIKGPHTLDLLSSTLRRYLRNQDVSIMIVEDSNVILKSTRKILETQHFTVITAGDGVEALQQLKANPTIQLVLTDYNMPKMDGFELTTKIRRNYPMDKMAIIGMSAKGDPLLAAQFLKRGANDFINKPYFEEELIWRVNQNIEILDRISLLREIAIKDVLTGLYNRRYFFEVGTEVLKTAKQKKLDLCIAMLDIDHFKAVNDTYGHASGDVVLKEVAKTLQESFGENDIVARIGGEEFVVITCSPSGTLEIDPFETLREKIAALVITAEGKTIQTSVSIGVSSVIRDNLDDMLSHADSLLYQAKNSGRNCVIVH